MNVQHEQLKNLMVREKRRILNFSSDSKVSSRYIDRTLYFFSYPKIKCTIFLLYL